MSELISSNVAAAMQYVEPDDKQTVLMVILKHAEEVCNETWPGGTVQIGENTEVEWSTRLSSCSGKCYYKRRENGEKYAVIRLAWGYYESNGLLAILKTLRHELVHAWQWLHSEGDPGHGPTFRQWMDDVDCSRYCKEW